MKNLTHEEVLRAVVYCSADYFCLSGTIVEDRTNAAILFWRNIDVWSVYPKTTLIESTVEKYRKAVEDAFLELEMSNL